MQEQEEQLSDGLLPVVVAVVGWLLPACKSSAPVSVGVEVAPLLVVVVVVLLPPRTVFVVRVVVVVFVFVVVVVLLVPLPSGIVRGAIPS